MLQRGLKARSCLGGGRRRLLLRLLLLLLLVLLLVLLLLVLLLVVRVRRVRVRPVRAQAGENLIRQRHELVAGDLR